MSKHDWWCTLRFGCLGCGFKVYTLLPSKYEENYHINDSLASGMALPQTPKSSVPWQPQWIHTFVLAQVVPFAVISIPAVTMHQG